MTHPIVEPALCRALDWTVRLPLLGDVELGLLLGIEVADARPLREELVRRGWVEWVTVRGDGLRARPLAFVREEALPALAELRRIPPTELAAHLPVGRAATLGRLARVGVVQGVNRMVAELAAGLRGTGDGAVDTACSLPLSVPAAERGWPPRVQAYVRVRAGQSAGSCLIAWDRAGAPDLHRREHVRLWSEAAGDAEDDAAPSLPPILVVCAGERELRVWERAVMRREETAGRMPVDLLLATAVDVLRSGALHAQWVVPGARDRCKLTELLDWQAARVSRRLEATALPTIARTRPSLRARLLPGGMVLGDDAPLREQVASLALALEPQGRVILEWVARHPWLTTRQLAVLLDDPEAALVRQLAVLVRQGTVRSVRVQGASHELWIATRRGLRPLAAAEQLPLARYERHGAVHAPLDAEDRPGEVVLPRAFEHALGVNRAFIELAAGARRDGGRLAVWRNEAESTQIFGASSERWWIRPDGSGVTVLDGTRTAFLLEYDRGTLGWNELGSKLRAYERYYEVEAWAEHFEAAPVLLFVCVDGRAAVRVRKAARGVAALSALCVTEPQRSTDALLLPPAGAGGRMPRSLPDFHSVTPAADGAAMRRT